MGKIFKNAKLFLLLMFIVLITIFGSNLFVVIKMNFTETKVSKVYFTNNYFVKAKNEETKIEYFKEFMLMDGWEFIENYYGTMIFRKGNLQKEISIDTLIKI